MSASESFLTIKSEVVAEEGVKGSKFIAHASPVSTREDAEDYLKRISDRFMDATHNCFAYKIGTGDRAIIRFSDAGEPSGTAGRPILQAIETKELANIVVVVARYFGGTKLGTGGLIRAYRSCALAALSKATTVEYYPQVILRLLFPYDLTNMAQHLIRKYGATVLERGFEEQSSLVIQLKATEAANFRNELNNVSSGKIEIL
ncbi:MAG: YigZ family protein [bacterium]